MRAIPGHVIVRCFTQSSAFVDAKIDEHGQRFVNLPADTRVTVQDGLLSTSLLDAQYGGYGEAYLEREEHSAALSVEPIITRCRRAEQEAYAFRVAYDELADVVSLNLAMWQTRRVCEARSIRGALLDGNLTAAVRRAEAIDLGSGQ